MLTEKWIYQFVSDVENGKFDTNEDLSQDQLKVKIKTIRKILRRIEEDFPMISQWHFEIIRDFADHTETFLD